MKTHSDSRMGRYCYFSNGFEYKFWFGIQESGFEFLKDAIGGDLGTYAGASEISFAFVVYPCKLLEYLQEYEHLKIPDWDKYEKTTTGTQMMYDDIIGQIDFSVYNDVTAANFCLACIIYHMSLYEKCIHGTYECY